MTTSLYYPTKAGATTTVNLPDPRPGGVVGAPRFFTEQQISDGGTRYAYEHGGPERVFDLSFLVNSQTIYDALVNMIRDDLRGPLNTFEATVLGVDYTGCRLLDKDFSQRLQVQMQCATIEIYPVRLTWTSE